MTIGDRIRAKRLEAKMPQTELASRANISKQLLYKYEKNIVTNIPTDVLTRIAKILDVSPIYLMGWENSDLPEAPKAKPIELPPRMDPVPQRVNPLEQKEFNKFLDTWKERAEREGEGLIEFMDDIGYPVIRLRDKYLEKNPEVTFLRRYTESDIYRYLINYQAFPIRKTFDSTFYVLLEMIINMSANERKELLLDMKKKRDED